MKITSVLLIAAALSFGAVAHAADTKTKDTPKGGTSRPETIKGESTDDKHKGNIELSSKSANPGPKDLKGGTANTADAKKANGSGNGKANVSDMHVTKTVDKSSPN